MAVALAYLVLRIIFKASVLDCHSIMRFFVLFCFVLFFSTRGLPFEWAAVAILELSNLVHFP